MSKGFCNRIHTLQTLHLSIPKQDTQIQSIHTLSNNHAQYQDLQNSQNSQQIASQTQHTAQTSTPIAAGEGRQEQQHTDGHVPERKREHEPVRASTDNVLLRRVPAQRVARRGHQHQQQRALSGQHSPGNQSQITLALACHRVYQEYIYIYTKSKSHM